MMLKVKVNKIMNFNIAYLTLSSASNNIVILSVAFWTLPATGLGARQPTTGRTGSNCVSGNCGPLMATLQLGSNSRKNLVILS